MAKHHNENDGEKFEVEKITTKDVPAAEAKETKKLASEQAAVNTDHKGSKDK
jgi:hypothetical protein